MEEQEVDPIEWLSLSSMVIKEEEWFGETITFIGDGEGGHSLNHHFFNLSYLLMLFIIVSLYIHALQMMQCSVHPGTLWSLHYSVVMPTYVMWE